MTSQNMNNDGLADEVPQRAVSLYGQGDGVEDFPVLKAFQQYIDAEQEKARKRIIWLGIFFGAILIVVVAVFLFLLHGINMRNQSLNDRLVEYAMSERRQPTPTIVAPQPSTEKNDEVLKSMTETLVALQKKMQDDSVAKAATTTVVAPDPRMQAEAERLTREKAALEAEKKRLDEERERLRQIEIDRQRRKLYPELYEERQSPSRSRKKVLSDEDIRDIIREAYPDNEEKDKDDEPVSGTSPKNKKTSSAEKQKEPDEDDAIDYFKDDNYNIPIDVKGSDSRIKFTVPVN